MIEIPGARVFLGDCRDVLKTLPDNSVDSVVTDPPYELGFMGKKWDNTGVAYDVTVWQECLRVLKPGGHILAFGGSRTWHRLAVAVEDAGFELRDSIAWIYGSGFPKSLDIGKKLDDWRGWGTALKPAHEPVVVGRKPLISTVVENVLQWGTGGMNIDSSRIPGTYPSVPPSEKSGRSNGLMGKPTAHPGTKPHSAGRWPANVILDEYTAELLDKQSGMSVSKSAKMSLPDIRSGNYGSGSKEDLGIDSVRGHDDSGGASRFFYVAKASKRDRSEGLQERNNHPTVKPTQLMRYLIKLVTPSGGTVLDPFTGSGSTGKAALLDGFEFIGIELTEDYLPIIENRLNWSLSAKHNNDQTLF